MQKRICKTRISGFWRMIFPAFLSKIMGALLILSVVEETSSVLSVLSCFSMAIEICLGILSAFFKLVLGRLSVSLSVFASYR